MKKIKIAFCLRDMQLGGVESVLIRTLDKLQEYKNIEISIITYVDILEPIPNGTPIRYQPIRMASKTAAVMTL